GVLEGQEQGVARLRCALRHSDLDRWSPHRSRRSRQAKARHPAGRGTRSSAHAALLDSRGQDAQVHARLPDAGQRWRAVLPLPPGHPRPAILIGRATTSAAEVEVEAADRDAWLERWELALDVTGAGLRFEEGAGEAGRDVKLERAEGGGE